MPHLAVKVAGSLYALPDSAVREITTLGHITRLPGAPDFVRGIANVRGVLVTVVDLARRLAGSASDELRSSVVVVEALGRPLGLLVDEVHEVLALTEQTGGSGTGGWPVAGGLVAGLGHSGEQIVLIIDVEELVRQTLA